MGRVLGLKKRKVGRYEMKLFVGACKVVDNKQRTLCFSVNQIGEK